jgi:hypothetical protein
VGFFRADLRPHGAGGAYEIESVTVGAAFIVVLYPLIGCLQSLSLYIYDTCLIG